MVHLDDLKVLGKVVMSAAVDAEMLGLKTVGDHLSMAFDEMARRAAELRAVAAREEAEGLLEKTRSGLNES